MSRGHTPQEGEKGGGNARYQPYTGGTSNNTPKAASLKSVGHTVDSAPSRAPTTTAPTPTAPTRRGVSVFSRLTEMVTRSPASTGQTRPAATTAADEDETMQDAPIDIFNQNLARGQEETGAAQTKLLELVLGKAIDILRKISIHAECPPIVVELAETIAQRIIPKKETTNPAPTESSTTTDTVLQEVVRTMERLTSRIDSMEARATRRNNGQETTVNWADDVETSLATTTPATTKRSNSKAGPRTSNATSKPITPKLRKEALPRPAVTNPLSAYHSSRLIVEIEDGPGPGERSTEVEIVKQINEALQSSDESRHLRVVNVKFNAQNNCIVFTRADQSAGDLAPFAENFIESITGGRRTRVRPDQKWYKVQLNGVRVHNNRTGEIMTPQEIEDELRALNPDYAKMAVHDLPRWMRHRADLGQNTHSSVVLTLTTETDANFLVNRVRNLAIGGNFVEARHYADKPPVMQCSRCWAYGHTRTRCKNPEKCRLCGKEDHNEAMHAQQRDAQEQQNKFMLLEAEHEKQRANDLEVLKKRYPSVSEDKCKATLELADGNFARAVAYMEGLAESPPQSPHMVQTGLEGNGN
ncbi:hypothetical protein DAEQUDRAFT_813756 [Daedalea quercina L-15889]|uniref:CCHC-type domain-containing protein n=1 Tax=Daedalea quercina L-15889 TaxID=1314783 RepID=A0A165MWX5_9APHY|nr:hypothetical protein DAEQUDRAFT_813756 [Daedalea quercina L-15889]